MLFLDNPIAALLLEEHCSGLEPTLTFLSWAIERHLTAKQDIQVAHLKVKHNGAEESLGNPVDEANRFAVKRPSP